MTSSARTRVRRRRQGVALGLALLAALGLAWSLPWGPDAPTAASSPAVTPGPGRTDEPALSAEVVPAWLAWMPGGFPTGFRRAVDGDRAFDATVVVAGDTLWMTRSRDADGALVDRPEPLRDEITHALDRGEAVLGATSADLRRLSPGGILTFGGTDLRVGAVVPDDVVGWSEVLVNRKVGSRLGITHDRYLLALDDGMTLRPFEARVRSFLPPDTTLRVEAPGGTPYVRVASGVNPPVVMKEVFGEFAAAPRTDDPAFLTMDPAWYETHIVTQEVPILGRVSCNAALMPALRGALQELVDRGLADLISVYSGCYAARTVARSDTAPPSQHAYGAAIDIDAPTNGYGDTTPAMDPRVVAVFERHGFLWGGDFLIPDGMHFEYGSRSDRDL